MERDHRGHRAGAGAVPGRRPGVLRPGGGAGRGLRAGGGRPSRRRSSAARRPCPWTRCWPSASRRRSSWASLPRPPWTTSAGGSSSPSPPPPRRCCGCGPPTSETCGTGCSASCWACRRRTSPTCPPARCSSPTTCPLAAVSSLDPANVVGIVLSHSGQVSHCAILARALEIPAVVGTPGSSRPSPGERWLWWTAPRARSTWGFPPNKLVGWGRNREQFRLLRDSLREFIGKETHTAEGVPPVPGGQHRQRERRAPGPGVRHRRGGPVPHGVHVPVQGLLPHRGGAVPGVPAHRPGAAGPAPHPAHPGRRRGQAAAPTSTTPRRRTRSWAAGGSGCACGRRGCSAPSCGPSCGPPPLGTCG